MDRNEKTESRARAGFSLSQETIAIVTVGVALAGIILVNQGDMRAEGRADRARMDATLNAFRAEAQADRARMDAKQEAFLAEARADRETFAKQVTRLVEQQGTLS